eukprot:scaffold1353_cov363-Pavlova_lutheri.AAC.6
MGGGDDPADRTPPQIRPMGRRYVFPGKGHVFECVSPRESRKIRAIQAGGRSRHRGWDERQPTTRRGSGETAPTTMAPSSASTDRAACTVQFPRPTTVFGFPAFVFKANRTRTDAPAGRSEGPPPYGHETRQVDFEDLGRSGAIPHTKKGLARDGVDGASRIKGKQWHKAPTTMPLLHGRAKDRSTCERNSTGSGCAMPSGDTSIPSGRSKLSWSLQKRQSQAPISPKAGKRNRKQRYAD